MVYIRVVHSSSRNIGVPEPFVVRLESELEKSVSAAQFKEFSNVHPVIQVFYTDGRLYTLLSPEFYQIHSVSYANNACTVHIVFNAIPNHQLLKFQTQFKWETLKLFTVTEAYTLQATNPGTGTGTGTTTTTTTFMDTLLSGTKRKREEDKPQPLKPQTAHAKTCACAKHNDALQTQIAVLHDQVALMREEILGYRSLFNDTLLKYVKPMDRISLSLPTIPVEPIISSPEHLWEQPFQLKDADVFEFMRDAVI